MKRTIYILICCAATVFYSSCEKLVEVAPPITSANGDNVFEEDAGAIAVLTSIYTNMSTAGVRNVNGRLTNICFTTGITGDELALVDLGDQYYTQYYNNNIQTNEITWGQIYSMIFVANSAIEKLPGSTGLTPEVGRQMLGEAYFIRALSYFYLVNLYGGVPMPLVTDYRVNRLLSRSSVNDVYAQIKSDLLQAQQLLSGNFTGSDGISTTTERVRPNKWAATALLAKTYLYTGEYGNAEAQADEVIRQNNLFGLVTLDEAFLMNNREAIWQLQPVGLAIENNANTKEGQFFNLRPIPEAMYTVYLTDRLVNSFATQDLRRTHWISSVMAGSRRLYFPYKYKIGQEPEPVREYTTVFRLAEMYLIRGEARIRQQRTDEGIADLNELRRRASDLNAPPAQQLAMLPDGLSQEAALKAVEDERNFELFTEWGNRWMDLKRTNRIDALLIGYKPGYQPTDKLFPIPQPEITKNPNLRGQRNPGYQ